MLVLRADSMGVKALLIMLPLAVNAVIGLLIAKWPRKRRTARQLEKLDD